MISVYEYIVIVAYLIMMLAIGPVCRKLNRNVGDYFRSGCQGTWWLVGMSGFMAGISALTFTGNGGAAYEAGWSVLAIYIANVAAYLIHALCFAPWFRQLRVITFPEAVRERFGSVTQQIYAYLGMVLFLMIASVWLYGLAVFCSATFGISVHVIIPVLGLVVLLYSTMGGKWAILSADFIQGVIMMSVTILLSILCLKHAGGLSGFLQKITDSGLDSTFAFIKPEGAFSGGQYTWTWALAVFFVQFVALSSLPQSVKYFAVKDSREARKAALIMAGLMAFGTVFWFIPPMTARLFFSDAVAAFNIPKPQETAFAVTSMQLLPRGLLGMIIVAMFSATTSSMDAGLNGNSAIIIRDAVPSLFRLFKKPLPEDAVLLHWSRVVTVVCGLLVIGMAEYLAVNTTAGIFRLGLAISSTVVMPMSVPLLLCLFVKRAPPWSCIVSMLAAMIPSCIAGANPGLMTFQQRVFWVLGTGAVTFMASTLFPSPESYRKSVDRFFEKMHRKVDFVSEVGEANDHVQMEIISRFAMAAGIFILLLLLIPNPAEGRVAIALLGAFILSVGAVFHFLSRRKTK